MLLLLLLMQWLEYILNANIIYFAVDIDKNYEQKTHFASGEKSPLKGGWTFSYS